ncbi:MAG TPA: FAD-dependent oxidoreductase [Thermomicrobiales bacterium]|jgi:glycine/D-amino acid oxidase-like deaminating enzyme
MATIHMDVVVIGGGITGTSIAYALARRGVRNVLLLEQRMTAGNTTRGAFGIVRTYHASRVMVSVARRSLRLYEQFEDETGGAAAFIRTGLLVLVPEGEQEMLEANVGVATHLGSNVQLLSTSDDVRSVEPRINLDGVAAVAYEPGAGYGDPVQISAAFAIRARDLGAQIRQGIRILNLDTEGEAGNRRITGVLTDGGYVNTGCVVNAGGMWGPAVSEMVGVELPVLSYRYLGVVLRHPPTFGGAHPITLDLVNGAVMRPSGPRLTLVGPLGAVAEDVVPPGWDDPRTDASAAPEYQTVLRRRYAELATATVQAAWATSHDVSPDWYPMIGPVNGVEGYYCALGMGGYSFALAPAVGEMVARLITDEGSDGVVRPRRSEDLDPKSHAYFFRPDRFAGRSAHPQTATPRHEERSGMESDPRDRRKPKNTT